MLTSKRKYVLLSLLLLSVVGVASQAYASHPAEGGVAHDISGYYANCPGPDRNYGEIEFVAGAEEPALASLTMLEQYMVGGMDRTSRGGSLLPWYQDVFQAAGQYYEKFGRMPAVLSMEELRKLPSMDWMTDEMFDIYRNPLTGQWPRLDATSFSRGDMYLKPLTQDEMRHFAAERPSLQRVWFDGVGTDLDAMQNGVPYDQAQTKRIELMGPVCYIRLYGMQGTILTDFVYASRQVNQ